MGFFSWKCCVSGESIANIYSGQPSWQTQCYLVTPYETIYENAYEGYGDFGGKDVYALLGDGDRDQGIDRAFGGKASFEIKLVLAKYYNGQTYDQLSPSKDCEYQGYFYEEDVYDDYEDDYEDEDWD